MQSLSQILRRPSILQSKEEIAEVKKNEMISDVVNALEPAEIVVHIVNGVVDEHVGIFAVSDRRVLFVTKGLVRKIIVSERSEDLVAVINAPKIFTSTIIVEHREGTLFIEKVTKSTAKDIVSYLEQVIGDSFSIEFD